MHRISPSSRIIFQLVVSFFVLCLVAMSGCGASNVIKMPQPVPDILKEHKSIKIQGFNTKAVNAGIHIRQGDYLTIMATGELRYFENWSRRLRSFGPEETLYWQIGENGRSVAYGFLNSRNNPIANDSGPLFLGLISAPTSYSGSLNVEIFVWEKEDPISIEKFFIELLSKDTNNTTLKEFTNYFKAKREYFLAEQKAKKEYEETQKALLALKEEPPSQAQEQKTSVAVNPPNKEIEEVKKTDPAKYTEPSGPKSVEEKRINPLLAEKEIPKAKDSPPVPERQSVGIRDMEKEKKIAELTERLEKALKNLKELEEKKNNLGGQGVKGTAQVPEKPKLAVWDLEARNTPTSHSKELTSILVSEITKLKRYEVYSQDNVRTLAGWTAQRMQIGCTDTSCLTALGQMDIDKLISGSVGKIGNRYSVSLNLFDTQKVKSANAVSEYCQKEDELIELIQQALSKLLGE
jgi:hypothetical protein